MPQPIILAPSILAGDHAELAASLRVVEEAQLSWIHLDMMDGHFVPNLTFGPQTVADLRKRSDIFFDVHLMYDEPHRYIEQYAKAGSNMITIHIEPDYDHGATLARIRELGCQCGIAINPDTPAETIEPFLDQIDLALVMTVQPGFGGQSFRMDTLGKISQLRDWREERGLDYRIETDGGINRETVVIAREAGCDTFVAGTAFFKAEDKADFIRTVVGS